MRPWSAKRLPAYLSGSYVPHFFWGTRHTRPGSLSLPFPFKFLFSPRGRQVGQLALSVLDVLLDH